MATLGVTFPNADDSVKYAVQQMNTALELGRMTACVQGLKELHQAILYEIERHRNEHIECDTCRLLHSFQPQSCDEKIVTKAFANYTGPTIAFFDEWKTLFLKMEEDVLALMCTDNQTNATKLLESMERITRSSYKSICGSNEVLIAMSPEAAMESVSAKLDPQLDATIIATNDALEYSNLNVEAVKEAANKVVHAVSCPYGFGVLTTHYYIMLAVFFSGVAISFFLLRIFSTSKR